MSTYNLYYICNICHFLVIKLGLCNYVTLLVNYYQSTKLYNMYPVSVIKY